MDERMRGIVLLIRAWAGSLFDPLSDESLAKYVEEGKFQDQVKMYDAGCRFVGEDEIVVNKEGHNSNEAVEWLINHNKAVRKIATEEMFSELDNNLRVDVTHPYMQNKYVLTFEDYIKLANRFEHPYCSVDAGSANDLTGENYDK